jgi:glycine cleavage system H protein
VTVGKLPPELKYTASHEWARAEGNEVRIGITDHAQSELTDIVFVDLPAVGKALKAKENALVLESVKTVADVYAPIDGTVSAVNTELKAHPEFVNQDPYGKGWLFNLKTGTAPDLTGLLSADEYRRTIEKTAGA